MFRQAITVSVLAGLAAILKKTGGVSELVSFGFTKDTALIGTIVVNVIIVILFAEMYWFIDQTGENKGEHFGLESPVDAYYFSTVTSSSVGYGDVLPKSKKAKMLVIFHIMTMFLIVLPILLKALEPGD